MKKTTLIIILNLFFIGFLHAQSWEVGVTTGINHSFQSGTVTSNGVEAKYVGKSGYELGLTVNKRITKRFYINSGIGVTKRAYGKTDMQMDSFLKADIISKWTVLNIPLQLNYRLPLSERFAFSPSLGVDFGFFIKSKSEFKYDDGRNAEFDYSYPFKLNPKQAHVFLGLGLGMLYRIDNQFSLLATPKISTDVNFGNMDNLHSISLNFTLLYSIPQKKDYVK